MICSLPISQRLLRGALAVLLLLAVGCTRDPEELLPFDGEERPATVSLSWSAPDMDVLSRADAEVSSKRVTGIWVGIFNAITGKKTGSKFFETVGSNDEAIIHNTLENIDARSGESRIVAVANYAYHYGITSNGALQARLGEGLRWKMRDLLDAVETWEEFRSIVVMPDDARDLTYGGSDFLMSGIFVPKGTAYSGAEWIDANTSSTYEIKRDANDLTAKGSIRLRRVLSHVKFNVTGGKTSEGKAVALKVNRWRVHYKPMLSYLYERETNAADEEQYIFGKFTPDFKPLESSTENVYEHNYIDALYSTSITTYSSRADTGADAGPTSYNFSFYQYENKHRGRTWEEDGKPYGTAYADREREYKEPLAGASDTPSAAARAHDGTAKERNTGLYKMLCATRDEPVTMAKKGGPNANVNNFATFVEIDAQVSYEATDGDGKSYTRTGDVTYVVHLGYCEGGDDEAAKSLDFNCRRNTEYTYTVTVNGLENIVVEVSEGTENQPGAEGIVVDTSETRIDLDAHYCVFNVGFTESELGALSYSLMAYFNGNEIAIVDSEKTASGRAEAVTYEELQNMEDAGKKAYLSQFYSWICFKATRDKSSLRLFKDGAAENSGQGGADYFIPENDPDLLYLEDLKAYKKNYIDEKKPFFQPVRNEKGEEIYWFTCFAREYVYYYDIDGSHMWSDTDADDKPSETGQYREIGWHNYVDERPRVCNLSISERQSSPDGESRYAHAKYRISQQSIQTFYISDQAGVGDGTAFGAEHTNESYGLNLRWADENPHVDGSAQFWNRDNGRWNMWHDRLADQPWNSVLLSNGEQEITIDGQKKRVAFQIAKEVPEIKPRSNVSTTWKVAAGDYFYRPATLYPVPMLMPMADGRSGMYDPNQTSEYYKALNACMSRNRDINGNGKIDANELRWYLPTVGKYIRMQIGAKALSEPLVPVNYFNPKEYILSNDHAYFHFISSDAFLLWAEEGGSLGTKGINPNEGWLTGWNIRCVRNLGSVPQRLLETDPIQAAYTHDRTRRIVAQTYYDPTVLRLFKIEGRGIDPHPVNDDYNQPYKAFQYAEKDCTSLRDADNGLSIDRNGIMSGWTESDWTKSLQKNGICGLYSEAADKSDLGTWRVPTQKELTILRRLHQYGDATVRIFDEPSGTLTKWLTCTHDMLAKDNDGSTSYRYCGIQYTGRDGFAYWTNSPSDENWSGANFKRRVRCVRDVD